MSYFWNISTSPLEFHHNQKYKEIAKEFVERYTASNLFGISAIEYYYHPDSLISFHIHQGSSNYLFELMGHTAFKNTLAEKNITLIKYHDLTYTAQPSANDSILITMHGKANINGTNYNILSTFVLRMNDTHGKIINHVLEIFI